MARPLLADPYFMKKAREERSSEINTCIACNQACLDQIFEQKIASCLVNPYACHETIYVSKPTTKAKKMAVIGAGPAGLAFSVEAAKRGHEVELFDSASEIGGQFNFAKKIPGKEEFEETIRYYNVQLKKYGVKINLNKKVDAKDFSVGAYNHIILATGVRARIPEIEGINNSKVVGYAEAINNPSALGKKIAIIGAGGIGIDVAELLVSQDHDPTQFPDQKEFFEEWGVDIKHQARGGVDGIPKQPPGPAREIWLFQRKEGKMGNGPGKTTGWIHRLALIARKVNMVPGVSYIKIDDKGLQIQKDGETKTYEVDNIILCAGQLSNHDLFAKFEALGIKNIHLIGGAKEPSELDARRAIEEGTRLALEL